MRALGSSAAIWSKAWGTKFVVVTSYRAPSRILCRKVMNSGAPSMTKMWLRVS